MIVLHDVTPDYAGLGKNAAAAKRAIGPNQSLQYFQGGGANGAPLQLLTPEQASKTTPDAAFSANHDIDTTYLDAYAQKHKGQLC